MLILNKKYNFKNNKFLKFFKNSVYNNNIKYGDIIYAKVVKIIYNFVILDSILKSESFVSIDEFKDENGEINIKVNDIVPVFVESLEDGAGNTILSRDKAKRISTWLYLEKMMILKRTIDGYVVNKVRGGLTININGLKAFLPGSLIDVYPIKNTSSFEGKLLNFKVIKLDRKLNNIVVSRKAVVEVLINKEKCILPSVLKENLIMNGVIKNITNYGAFIDLGGIDGLLHITDIAWRRIRHPSEILSLGQKIKVKIIKYDKIKKRVSLGMKQLSINPWIGLRKRYLKNMKFYGKVTNITDYGIFVEIEKGIEGLVHVSQMVWANKNFCSRFYKVGDRVEYIFLNINEVRRRISLGIKQCKLNIWNEFYKFYKKYNEIDGFVKSITDFGLFIILNNNLIGLIYISNLNFSFRLLKKFRIGDEVKSIISNVNIKKERISLYFKKNKNYYLYILNLFKKKYIISGIIEFIYFNIIKIRIFNKISCYLLSNYIFHYKFFNIGDRIFLYKPFNIKFIY